MFSTLIHSIKNAGLNSLKQTRLKQDKYLLVNLNCIRQLSVSRAATMRFVQFKSKSGGPQQLGVQLSVDGDIIDISAVDSTIPNSLVKFLNTEDSIKEKAKRIVADARSVIPLKDVNLLAPITKPDKVACVGLNYSGHCAEKNIPCPTNPVFFSKFSSVITGPHDNIVVTNVTEKVDWEVELAVVIGKQAKAIEPAQAKEYIFGYTVAQDIGARDWQGAKNNNQFLLAKSMDTFCPLGPAVVAKENVGDPNKLTLKTWVNGVLKQNGNTSEMVFKIDYLVSYLSKIVTLYPGDLILTGTPSGVGVHRNPPEFLKNGDVLESEIEGIGKLRNLVVKTE